MASSLQFLFLSHHKVVRAIIELDNFFFLICILIRVIRFNDSLLLLPILNIVSKIICNNNCYIIALWPQEAPLIVQTIKIVKKVKFFNSLAMLNHLQHIYDLLTSVSSFHPQMKRTFPAFHLAAYPSSSQLSEKKHFRTKKTFSFQ